MFVDPVSFGVLQWISCLFGKFASQFHGFYCFSVHWPSNMDISLNHHEIPSPGLVTVVPRFCQSETSETYLEVEKEDSNVLGRCLTRDANVVGS